MDAQEKMRRLVMYYQEPGVSDPQPAEALEKLYAECEYQFDDYLYFAKRHKDNFFEFVEKSAEKLRKKLPPSTT